METILEKRKNQVLEGKLLNKEEALELAEMPLEELCAAADDIRRAFCGNRFDLCTIVNGKNGKCSENCKYCAQSSFYDTKVSGYPLRDTKELLEQAEYNGIRGVPRYSIVTSGKRLSPSDVGRILRTFKIKKNVEVTYNGKIII